MTIGTQLLGHPATQEPGYPWDERVPPPGRDATLLAVVPIPGTRTSLAIVGYAIRMSGEPEADPAAPAPDLGRRRRDHTDLPGVRTAGLPLRAPGHRVQPRGSLAPRLEVRDRPEPR